jgi:hypothetical protein
VELAVLAQQVFHLMALLQEQDKTLVEQFILPAAALVVAISLLVAQVV